jgi:phenylacetate-CoA ligase
VVTTLTNDFMPLLRYRIGDLVERCEHPYATTYPVHGRVGDTLLRRDGRRVTTHDVDECFSGVGGIAHYQLRQNAAGDCRLQYVPDGDGPVAEELHRVTAQLEHLLQLSKHPVAELVTMLPPTPSGKFRLTRRA